MKHRADRSRPTVPVILAPDQLAGVTGGAEDDTEAGSEKIKR